MTFLDCLGLVVLLIASIPFWFVAVPFLIFTLPIWGTALVIYLAMWAFSVIGWWSVVVLAVLFGLIGWGAVVGSQDDIIEQAARYREGIPMDRPIMLGELDTRNH